MDQSDYLLGKSSSVHWGLPEGPGMLQHRQEVQSLSAHIDEVQRQLSVWVGAERAAGTQMVEAGSDLGPQTEC